MRAFCDLEAEAFEIRLPYSLCRRFGSSYLQSLNKRSYSGPTYSTYIKYFGQVYQYMLPKTDVVLYNIMPLCIISRVISFR